ncbi:hypothetical protein GOV09_02500 [Candidatus Woesearchaeota archaeon]|nr:hypothetical protein [Candidatus Woesearchaeota archaeon]
MRRTRLKKAITWDFIGWFLFVLLVLIVILLIIGKFKGSSFALLDNLFGT